MRSPFLEKLYVHAFFEHVHSLFFVSSFFIPIKLNSSIQDITSIQSSKLLKIENPFSSICIYIQTNNDTVFFIEFFLWIFVSSLNQ